MTSRYLDLAFTPSVKDVQLAEGSRAAYAKREGGATEPDRLTDDEALFISARDSFYMATVGSGGWPYVQHRGGPAGFVKVLDEGRLGFADFRGNRQYMSVGNLMDDNRAAFFFMDYPRRARLKLLGRVTTVTSSEDPDLLERLALPDYGAKVERAMVVDVEAFDWNCSQHITPRFTAKDIQPGVDVLKQRIADLEAQVAALTAGR